MKKTTSLKIILAVLITSLACQAITNFSEASPPITSEPVNALTPTKIVDITPPSEGWIAFENKDNIWLVHPDGSGLKQVTNIPVDDQNINIYDFKWSPDGNRLAISQGSLKETAIYLYDIQTSETTTLITNTAGGFDWSLDGDEIIYDTPFSQSDPWDNNGLWVINLENGNKGQVVFPSNENSGFMDPEFSSDGSHVIFRIPAWEPAGYGVSDLSGSTGSIKLPDLGGNCEWALNRLIIACAKYIFSGTPDKWIQAVVLLDTQGNILQEIPLAEKMGYPGSYWSPDGEKLAITYYSNTKAWTDILSTDTEEIQPLASGFISDWSPDGRWILTWVSERKIFVTNVSSGKSFEVSEGILAVWQPFGNFPTSSQQDVHLTATPADSPDSINTPLSLQSPCTNVSITVNDTPKGNFLQICADGEQYEIGPLQKGAYAIGPNKKFFVYCTNNGDVYAGRIGETSLALIGDIKEFSIIVRKEAPELEFEFFGDHPYTVKVKELILEQSKDFSIPRYITTPN